MIQNKLKSHNIVLVGNFNPKIFQPSWFGAQGLIQTQEAEKAEIQVIHTDVALFRLDWLELEVTRERFTVRTSQEPYDTALRDIVMGTFSLLSFTPITKMGINRDMYFQMESEEQWHKVGNTLAPKDIWNEIVDSPGMRNVTIQGNPKEDGLKGYIRVQVEPSKKYEFGLHINVNDHFEVENPESVDGCEEIVNALKNSWDASYQKSEDIINSLLEKFK